MPVFKYQAIRVRQTGSENHLVLFGASATEIDVWAGVPQKKELYDDDSAEGGETIGFQREVNTKRLRSLKDFYRNEANIVQNPILCATHHTPLGRVTFTPDTKTSTSEKAPETGVLTIEIESLEEQSLLSILKQVKRDLESRVPYLAQHRVSDQILLQLKRRVQLPSSGEEAANTEETETEQTDAESSSEEEAEATEVVFSDESHILDFWEEVTARIQVLEELGGSFEGDSLLGYSKEAMISFLRPLVVVDGQHRLQGALETAKELTREDPYRTEIERAITRGGDPKKVQREIEARAARIMPVSLLMTTDPAEHVFQFVVVNQKATPINRALLGTIVSTSLSNEELARVSDRLTKAGIPLEESRSIAYFSRHPESPFFGLVERGLASDAKDLLPWSVLGSLVRIFRDLRGGRLFHERNDYADKWRRDYLDISGVVMEWEGRGCESPYDFWRQPDGPWRDVFVSFWNEVRDTLASANDEQEWHYWGSPRQSNIFNKISLTILAADFFQSLCDRRLAIDEVQAIPKLVEEWLNGVNENYFNRDWRLQGVKKDTTGIRNRWSKTWVEYRKDPQRLPDVRLYRQPATTD